MDENPHSSKQKILDKNNNDKDKNIDKNKKYNLKDCYFCKCCLNCISYFKNRKMNCISNCSIMKQFLFTFVPLAHIISLVLTLAHLYLFDSIFKFDYYMSIKEEYLRFMITDIDDTHFEITKIGIKNQFEDIANIIFFKIYFGELISLGLLDEGKIFPNISSLSETFYYYADEYLISDGSNSIYSIPQDISRQYIDERNDCLSDLGKIYYYFEPLIGYEAYVTQTYINQTFLIGYQINDNNNEIEGTEIYFNFPKRQDNYFNNFHPYNNYIAPKVNKSRTENSESFNNSFLYQNWFIKQDYNFRSISSELIDLSINYLHLNYNNEGTINKTTILSMQNFFRSKKGKRFIINVIFFINQKKLINNDFDNSLFIITNFSSNFLSKKTYSDNETFVISQNDITELSISSLISDYFHYGLTSNDYNFYNKGVFYENIDINYFSEPNDYYSTIKGFNFDIRYFSPFYLYNKLFQKTSFTKNYSESEYINIYYFNDTWQIKDICSKFNFSLYKTYLTSNNINCLDKKNLLYYYNNKSENTIAEDVTIPYCICLPLYCIKDVETNFINDKFEFVESITLPEKCHNNLKFYQNQIIEENLKKERKDKGIDSSDVKLRKGENLNDQLEDEFIKFSYNKFDLIGGLNFIFISIVDNSSLKIILFNLIKEIEMIRTYFIAIITTGINILIICTYIILMIKIYKISNIIYEYKKKLNIYAIQMQSKITNLSNKNDNLNNNIINDFITIDSSENFPLLENGEDNKINNEDNSLINELFLIYCNFYKISEEIIMKNYEQNKERSNLLKKIKTMTNNNELFNLFSTMSMYIPNFKLALNFDFDFYKDSKLMKNFLKYINKNSSINNDNNQIIYSKSIIYELLSTELVNDYGFITNINFNYITDINLNNKKKNNPIQNAIFKQIGNLEKSDKKLRKKVMIYDDIDKDSENSTIKLVWKNKNLIMKSIEDKFEQDDYLNLDKLKSSFNTSLINNYYNYLNRIMSK